MVGQQRHLLGAAVVGRSILAAGLDQVPERVELVTPLQVAVARGLARPAEVGVEVAVRFLGGDDPRGDALAASKLPSQPSRSSQYSTWASDTSWLRV